jgi:hypothetical protein
MASVREVDAPTNVDAVRELPPASSDGCLRRAIENGGG